MRGAKIDRAKGERKQVTGERNRSCPENPGNRSEGSVSIMIRRVEKETLSLRRTRRPRNIKKLPKKQKKKEGPEQQKEHFPALYILC